VECKVSPGPTRRGGQTLQPTSETLDSAHLSMSNVFFLYGNDEFAITRRLKEFEAGFSDPTSADMNTARLEARTMGSDELNTAVNAMPFLATKRLVLLANPSGKYAKPNERKKFEEFIEKVPETAQLVIYEAI
jgi:DNA polymerase III delta subunit